MSASLSVDIQACYITRLAFKKTEKVSTLGWEYLFTRYTTEKEVIILKLVPQAC